MQIISTLTNDTRLPLALTIGNFDGIHIGHQAILNTLVETALQNDFIPAAMTFSPHAKAFFGNTENFLINSDDEKAALIAQSGIKTLYQIPFNQSFSQISPYDFIEKLINHLHVKYLLIGDDFRFGHKGQGDFQLLSKLCDKNNIIVRNTPTIHCEDQRVSSSRIRDAISNSDFVLVKKLLGRPLQYQGTVISGKKLGRSINFPTANIRLSDDRILPKGVFVVKINIQGDSKTHYGMCNIGTKPTVDEELIRQIEVNVFDFSDNLYDKTIIIEPITKLRDEKKFDGIESLINQLNQDKTNSISILTKVII